MAGVFDVLKTAEYNQSSAIQPVQVSSHNNGKVRCYGADDNGLYAQEPCEAESLKHGFVAEVRRETASPTAPRPCLNENLGKSVLCHSELSVWSNALQICSSE